MASGLTVVTGAGGFIGSNLVSTLTAAGEEVVVCDRFGNDDRWHYIAPFLIHDIIEPESLFAWLNHNAAAVSSIVHMGAISATTEADIGKIIKENIRFTLDLWRHAASHDTTFVYASSAATYGDGSAGFVDDDRLEALAQLRPLNAYGWSKHFVDRRIVDDVRRGRPQPRRWAGLKFFNVYGPNEAHKGGMRSVVHQIYPVAARGEVVRLFKSDDPSYEDGGQLRDFVYVKDCCEIIGRFLTGEGTSGIFNAGTGTARSFADLARAVFAAAGAKPKIEYVEMPDQLRGRYQYFTQADTTKLAAAGLAPRFHSLEAGVADYVAHHLAQEFDEARARRERQGGPA
jgi:ADP-L-glycero-D-manno-heptose 6-epimerase